MTPDQLDLAGNGFLLGRNDIFAACWEPRCLGADLCGQGKRCREIDMSGRATDDEAHEPATLLRVMQAAIADGLRERYPPPRKVSHQLFVLMMQMNDRARSERGLVEPAAKMKAKAGKCRNAPPIVCKY